MSNLYRQLFIWKHRGNEAVRYCCFEELASGRFFVQSADFFRLPIDTQSVAAMDRQLVELFLETEPARRTSGYASLEEAISAHDLDFSPQN